MPLAIGARRLTASSPCRDDDYLVSGIDDPLGPCGDVLEGLHPPLDPPAEAEHVAQHECRPLAGRQVLEGDDDASSIVSLASYRAGGPGERSGISSSRTSG
jgi:hypothetical protein